VEEFEEEWEGEGWEDVPGEDWDWEDDSSSETPLIFFYILPTLKAFLDRMKIFLCHHCSRHLLPPLFARL